MSETNVIYVEDRHELTFIIFVRDNNPSRGRIHHDPTPSSKKRFAKVIQKLYAENKINVLSFTDNPSVYRYQLK